MVSTEAIAQRCSAKKIFLEISQNSHEIICVRQSTFFDKVDNLIKKETDTGVFLWILRNFSEHLFYRTPLGNCFCQYLLFFPALCVPLENNSSFWKKIAV